MLSRGFQFYRAGRACVSARRNITLFLALLVFILFGGWSGAVRAQVKFDGVDDDGCLDFTWVEPSNAESVVAHYNIYVSIDGAAFQQVDTTVSNNYSAPGDSGHIYQIKVAGVNHSGEEGLHSPESDEILCVASQPDQIPPKSVSGLTAQESDGNLLLSWPQVTEDSLGGSEQISHYVVYRSAEASFTPQESDSIAGVTAPSYLDSQSGIGSPGLNQYYIITAVDMAGNESGGSNTVGEFDYGIIPGTAGYYLVSPVLDNGQMATTSDLGQSIANCTAVKEWDPETQSYRSCAFKIAETWYGETALTPGYAYYVFIQAGSESSWTVTGTVPEDPVFTLHAPGGNGYNTITLPLSSTMSQAGELGQSIPHCTAVKQWNPSSQGFESIAFKVGDTWYGTAPLQPGRPYFVNVTADGIWPEGKTVLSYDDRLRQSDHE